MLRYSDYIQITSYNKQSHLKSRTLLRHDCVRWCGRKEVDLKEEEEEIDPLEEVDLDPRKEKEDLMSPRRKPLWQSMCVTLAQL